MPSVSGRVLVGLSVVFDVLVAVTLLSQGDKTVGWIAVGILGGAGLLGAISLANTLFAHINEGNPAEEEALEREQAPDTQGKPRSCDCGSWCLWIGLCFTAIPLQYIFDYRPLMCLDVTVPDAHLHASVTVFLATDTLAPLHDAI